MTSEHYEITKYQPAFKDQVLALQKNLWGPDIHLNAAYLDWKYDQNPYVDEPLIWLAHCAGQVIGMLGSFGAAWEIGPTEIMHSLSLADLVIDPAHRNRRILPKLLEFALQELAHSAYPVVFDLSATPDVALVMMMNGWRSIYLQTAHRQYYPSVTRDSATRDQGQTSWPRQSYGKLRTYAKTTPLVVNLYQHLRRVKQKVFTQQARTQARHSFQTFDENQAKRRPQDKPQIRVQTVPQPARMAELVRRLPQDGRIRHIRDEQYFTWRFQNPLSCYRFLFWEEAQLEGYLVLQTKATAHDATAWVNIVDWEATNESAALELLDAALAWGELKELEIWTATITEGVKIRLADRDFCFRNRTGSAVRDAHGEHLMFHPLPSEYGQAYNNQTSRHLADLASWDIRMIYSDGV